MANSLLVRHAQGRPPLLVILTSQFVPKPPAKLNPKKDQPSVETTLIPSGVVLKGEHNVARLLARLQPNSGLYGSCSADSALVQSEIDSWLDDSKDLLDLDEAKLGDQLSALNSFLTFRTFFIGHSITLADLAVWCALAGNAHWSAEKFTEQHPHVCRWYLHLASLPEFVAVKDSLPKKVEKKVAVAEESNKKTISTGAQGSFEGLLVGAEMGKVVTRFPPEPSGYLHIGHLKAALLNNYYAKHYKGKLIVRFDDTNPCKEKEEYVENILKDLKTVGIVPDQVTYTSDHFDYIMDCTEKLITSGKAYVDDTPVEQMRDERNNGTESKCRNLSVEENLRRWREMVHGTAEGQKMAVRAKIDMSSKNGVMRDPTLYRYVGQPHHRTGYKYKVYPLYDLACPIVDSKEGVTHALRSNEYHDRNPLYYWVLEALNLRRVEITDFSRLNFMYTVLSKRKLQQFVDQKLVEGWNDPSFPTIQGVFRRGLTLEALEKFVLSQGASRAVNLMDPAKLWALNKQIIDPIIPRHTAIVTEGRCPLRLSNGPKAPEAKTVPRHRKNPALGNKVIYHASTLFIEQVDANLLGLNEEVTLMDWGNCIITEVKKENGKVVEVLGKLHLEGDFKTTEKKLTWLADVPELCPVKLLTCGNLITKKSLEKEDPFEKYMNRSIHQWTEAFGDANLKNVGKGERLQLERKGYYIVDKPYLGPDQPLVLITIPDGKAAAPEKKENDKKDAK